MTRETGMVAKGWGCERIFATNEQYCGKLLHFEKGKRMSMHFHLKKHETWYVYSGVFDFEFVTPEFAQRHHEELWPGNVRVIPPGLPHRLTCREAGMIIEVSTPDSVEDNYRIEPGDSQKIGETE